MSNCKFEVAFDCCRYLTILFIYLFTESSMGSDVRQGATKVRKFDKGKWCKSSRKEVQTPISRNLKKSWKS